MLSKKRRVNRALFSQSPINSKSFNSNNLSMRVFSIKNTNKTKFSFVVSKKISNKAVKRNLLKKRSYSTIRNISKNINNGFVCIFFFKKNSTLFSYKDIKKEILFLLKKAKVLN